MLTYYNMSIYAVRCHICVALTLILRNECHNHTYMTFYHTRRIQTNLPPKAHDGAFKGSWMYHVTCVVLGVYPTRSKESLRPEKNSYARAHHGVRAGTILRVSEFTTTAEESLRPGVTSLRPRSLRSPGRNYTQGV